MCSLQVHGDKEPLHRVLHGGWEGKELGSHLFIFIHLLIHLTNTVFMTGHLSSPEAMVENTGGNKSGTISALMKLSIQQESPPLNQ